MIMLPALRGVIQRSTRIYPNQWTIIRALSSLPDHKLIRMPALSPTMEVGTIQEWKKKVGDEIEGGEVIAEIETDKATRSYEYNDDGYLAKVFFEDGAADVPVGTPVAIVVEEQEDIEAFKNYVPDDSPSEAAPEAPQQEPTPAAHAEAPAPPVTPSSGFSAAAATATAPQTTGARVLASPLARITASNAGLSLKSIAGTGPGGRVLAADVEDALVHGVPKPSEPSIGHLPGMPMYTDVEVSKYKRVTAERLLQSKQTIPHYYLTVECTVDKMLQLRGAINAKAKEGEYKISVNDFVVKAAAAALRKVPEVNSQWMGDKIRTYHAADISIAVQTEQGLITPIVKDADRKGLKEISNDVKQLAAKARDNALTPEEFMGGTFTISNLGMFGVSNFSAIVNPPQAAILAVGNSEQKVVPDESSLNGFGTKTVMSVTLSCDHRVVDGAVGAQWLAFFKSCLEDPVNIIM
eukprot:TRINITY_DN953_c0_g1_i4.p1 TRINITY_DN953_c0_g1~~TRINITY_DN953_c0_g1_i4.p1  ORF type:complete len:465 (-),score=78.90 TRINITY_DN953_c0_g1_i4:3036-4430(-)